MPRYNNINPFAKPPEVRLKEIDEELDKINLRIEELQNRKGELIKGLSGEIGDKGTQDILEKVREQRLKQNKK